MHDTVMGSTDMWFDPSGYYVLALTTLLLCILLALYFANFLKDDAELEDEGLGAEELRLEDECDVNPMAEMRRRLQSEIDDDEAYDEEEQDALSESDAEQAPANAADYINLVGKFKAKQYQHKLEKNLSPSQIEEERRIEHEQLAAIFELLRRQEDELNLKDRISDRELKQQVKLYR